MSIPFMRSISAAIGLCCCILSLFRILVCIIASVITFAAIKGNTLGEVKGANGGTLACRKGPDPEKSLAHPAIIDWALTEYLIVCSVG